MNDHLQWFFAAWMRHDADEMAQFYAVDARMEDPTLAQPIDGRGAIRDYYANMYGSLENAEHELLDHAVSGDRVWFEWTFTSGGVHSPRASYRGVSIQTLRAGLIVHDHAFWSPDD